MKNILRYSWNIAFVLLFGAFLLNCASVATTNEIKEYPKWSDELVPFLNESSDSKIGMFYANLGNGIEKSCTFSTPNNNGPSLIVSLTTTTLSPNMNFSSTFELVSISRNGGTIVGKCISSTGMAQSVYTNGKLYTLCDSYELNGEGVGAELVFIGGTMGSRNKFNLISQ